jgi:competence ComEA-like helix-hairpin-helix protein
LANGFAVVSVILLLRLVGSALLVLFADAGPVLLPTAIDVNRAPIAELMLLEGIGRTRAEQIVLHRVRYGWFRRIEDLAAVDGIGEGTVERLRGLVRVGE